MTTLSVIYRALTVRMSAKSGGRINPSAAFLFFTPFALSKNQAGFRNHQGP
jgi:hypothetical protein